MNWANGAMAYLQRNSEPSVISITLSDHIIAWSLKVMRKLLKLIDLHFSVEPFESIRTADQNGNTSVTVRPQSDSILIPSLPIQFVVL
jgi:hypothetical protein